MRNGNGNPYAKWGMGWNNHSLMNMRSSWARRGGKSNEKGRLVMTKLFAQTPATTWTPRDMCWKNHAK